MSEIFLGLLAILQLTGFICYVYITNQEKAKLVNAIIARNAQEMTNLTLADQTQIKPEVSVPNPDLVPTDQMTDEQFDDHIQQELTNG